MELAWIIVGVNNLLCLHMWSAKEQQQHWDCVPCQPYIPVLEITVQYFCPKETSGIGFFSKIFVFLISVWCVMVYQKAYMYQYPRIVNSGSCVVSVCLDIETLGLKLCLVIDHHHRCTVTPPMSTCSYCTVTQWGYFVCVTTCLPIISPQRAS